MLTPKQIVRTTCIFHYINIKYQRFMLNTQIKKRNETTNNSCLTQKLYNGQSNDEDIERTTKLLQDELTSRPDIMDPKERDGF